MCFIQMLIVLMLFVLRLFIGFLCCLIHRTQLPEGSYIWPAFGTENISRPWLLRICQSGDNALNSCICSQILGRRRMEFMIWGESQYGMQIGCFLPEENITFNNSLVFLQPKKSEMQHLPPWVGPGSELEVTLLVVKGEPGDVDLARRLRRESYMSELIGLGNPRHVVVLLCYLLTYRPMPTPTPIPIPIQTLE